MNANQDLLSVTAFFSALIHVVVILGVSFKLPELASLDNTDNTLDVVLINNANNQTPDEAETVSSSDNVGGGNDDLEASSPLPYKAIDPSPIDSIKLTAEQEAVTERNPDKLITSNAAKITVQNETPKETTLEIKDKSTGQDKLTTKSARQLERERLIAKLSREWQDYQKRPNKEYLSPTTMSNEAATYLDAWRRKVEKVGNANYPVKAQAQGLTGTLILSVEINRDGTISSVLINKPSEHKVLNDAALRFVRRAAPYAAFTDQIDEKTDILVITRAFHFLSSNQVTTSDAASSR